MNIALTTEYMDSLARQTGTDIKRAMQTVMSLKKESAAAGLRAHKIEHPCGHIVSYSVNMDLRIVAYQKDDTNILLNIDHHDECYDWLRKRNFVIGPNEDFRIITTLGEDVPHATKILQEKRLYKKEKEGIPDDVVDKILTLKNDDDLFDFIYSQPLEFQERLFELSLNVFKKDRCRVSEKFGSKTVSDDVVLEKALLYPLEKWRIFLHPKQEELINMPITETSLISGAPGTGKTVCLVHKAKKYGDIMKSDECIIISTYKDNLQDYILSMLQGLNYNSKNVFIVDISAINQLDEYYSKNYKYDGFFYVQKNHIRFINNNRHYYVKHILIDEYQDYKFREVNVIKHLSDYVPITIAYDYSQSIYRTIERSADSYEHSNSKVVLTFSYRLTERILTRLKKIMNLIQVLSNSNILQGGVSSEETRAIQTAKSVIDGNDINLLEYKNDVEKNKIIENEYLSYRNTYSNSDIVVTTFVRSIHQHLSEASNYQVETVPNIVRSSYQYLPTLKGKEFKAGIIVLDRNVCQAINFNRLLFGYLDDKQSGIQKCARFYYNLLYVALSRFRDYITVLYPEEYKEVILPLLG